MKKLVYAYLHTHWDREWYQDKESFNLRFLEVFDIVIDELKNNKAPFFYLDGQTIALLDYLKYRKDKIDDVINLIKENKLAIGPYYVSADSYLVNFMCMLKNLDLGIKTSKLYGQKNYYIGYLSDIFGISKSVFEALKLKNIDKAIIWRGVNPKKIYNNCDFIKNDIKTTWLVQGYFNDFFHNDKINIENIENHLDKINQYSSSCLLMPIGADHLGILKNAQDKINYINSKLKNYKIILTSPFEYFKHTKYENNIKEEEFLDNSNTYILSGVYSARIPQKIRNNQLQNDLTRIVEPLNYFLCDNYQSYIDEIYKTLIKNHAHDGIYGCSTDIVHRTIDDRLNKIENMINGVKKRLIGNFKKKYNINGHSEDKIGLINLSNYGSLKTIKVRLPYILKNSQILNIEKGFEDDLLYDIYKIPVTEDITNIYTQLIEISNNKSFEFNTVKIKKPIKKHKITNNSIENNFIKLTVKGEKLEILNKKTNKKYDLLLTDIKDDGDSYNFAPKGEYKIQKILNSKILYEGEISSCLEIKYKNILLDIVIDNHNDFLKFNSKINNKTKNHKLQFVMKLDKNIVQTISEEAIGIIKRKIDCNYKMSDYMPTKRPFELKTNSFPMQNFVCCEDLIVLTKGLNEYEIYKNELRICLLRCFNTISNPKNKARSIPAGPNLETKTSQEIKLSSQEFMLCFGNYKKAFKIVDNLFENYICIDGIYEKNQNINFVNIDQNSYFYGINENKKITYDYKNDKINVI